ncbi:MAG: histone deacetylase [Anaerolineales bacterium]|jgi:acetoin utilization deacetylase AcuC-like enzyme
MIVVAAVKSSHHILSGHPEGPHRFQSIRDQLSEHLGDSVQWVEPEPIEAATLELVHSPSYIDFIREQASQGPGIVDYGDTYVTKSSFQDAINATAGALTLLDRIMKGEHRKGFAIIRPPGHHATSQKAMGFCLFNNIAITARRALNMGLQRLAIVDFDVHHGNGTQDIFYSDPDILYISTHQWGIFPGTGSKTEIGQGEGRGATVNVPLPGGVGDAGFNIVFDHLIIPVLRRFQPEMLFVSAGYDAHINDPLASLQLTTPGYYHLTRKLVEFADDFCEGRVLMVLEGGYNPDALARSIRNSCLALNYQKLTTEPDTEAQLAEPDIKDLVDQLRKIHKI